MGQRIHDIMLTRVDLPLIKPYRLSYRTIENLEPILVRVRNDDGMEGWEEQRFVANVSARRQA